MKYICKKALPGLTIGATYTEYFANPCMFNAAVINDEAKVMHAPRKECFDVVEEIASKSDAVKNPSHYQVIDGVEAIEIIASVMSDEQWKGYCLGNIIKYRLRAGKKNKLDQDIGKADFYNELYDLHKHLCRGNV